MKMSTSETPLEDLFEFWTPTEIQTYVNTVAAGFHALAEDFKNTKTVLDVAQQKAWALALSNFLEFYKGVGFFSRLVLGTLRSAEGYATQLRYWRDIYEAKTGRAATGATVAIPVEGQKETAATIKTALIVAGICAGAWFGIEALKTARVFKGAL